MGRAAWHDLSQAYDSPYYHLPFAARLGGVVGPEAYVFSPVNDARYRGFPLLAELLQGLLFRVTGRPEAANLVAWASVPALAGYVSWRLRVPFGLAVFALLAVPLVQTHATSAYVDLPANVAATLLLLEGLALVGEKRPPSAAALVRALGFAAFAAHMRFQLVPTVALGLGLCALASLRRRGRRGRLLLLAAGAPLVFGKLLTNLVWLGNPVYPVELRVLGHALPFAETAYASSPDHLASASRGVRFVHSIFELSSPPLGDPSRWTVDQYAPPGSAAYRMGGFFGAYVALHLLLFVALAWRDRSGQARRRAAVFAALSVLVAQAPQSHELRYYMVWMLVLVSLNLAEAGVYRRGEGRAVAGLLSALVLASFGAVAWFTGGVWLAPSGSRLEEVIARRVDVSAVRSVEEEETVCLWRPPWTFFYAAPFHSPRRYRLVEGEVPEACGALRRP